MHTIITKLYVSKLNENKEQIPTKIHVHQTTIFSQKLLPDVTRWRHMVLTHIFMLSVICKTVIVTLLSRFMQVVELSRLTLTFLNRSGAWQHLEKNVCFPVNLFLFMAFYILAANSRVE